LRTRLKIGRNTVRGALDLLEREGLLDVARGRRRRIRSTPSQDSTRPKLPRTRIVGLLTSTPVYTISPFGLFLISEIQQNLHDAGYQLEIHSDAKFAAPDPSKTLRNLLAYSRAACWVLIGPTLQMVRWFERQNVPALAQGGYVIDMKLPMADVDSGAIVRHAVRTLLSRGHARIALTMGASDMPGESALTRQFSDTFEKFRYLLRDSDANAFATAVLHRSKPDAMREALDQLWNASTSARRPPPTALLINRPRHVLTAMTHLAEMGLRVPQDVSLISMHHLAYLDEIRPTVAHYTFDWRAFARRFTALARRLADGSTLSVRRRLLATPEFRDGGTLATLATRK
jgi:DNA-binding LacI/PurR family transcriptional regulator